MLGVTLPDQAPVSANAMLTAKAYTALSAASRGCALTDVQARVLLRAAELLGRMVEGWVLVAQQGVRGFSPSYRGLEEYTRAMPVLRALASSSGNTPKFVRYRVDLKRLVEGKRLATRELAELKDLFAALSDHFDSDCSTIVASSPEEIPDLEG
jgi:hypothetical protein